MPVGREELQTQPMFELMEAPALSTDGLSQTLGVKKTKVLIKFLTYFWGPIPCLPFHFQSASVKSPGIRGKSEVTRSLCSLCRLYAAYAFISMQGASFTECSRLAWR